MSNASGMTFGVGGAPAVGTLLTPRPQGLTRRMRLALGVGLACFGLVGLVVSMSFQNRDRAVEAARASTAADARLAELHLARTIDAIQAVLRVAAGLIAAGADGPADDRQARFVAGIGAGVPDIQALRVVEAGTGRPVLAVEMGGRALDAIEREALDAYEADRERLVHVSRPVRDAALGRWTAGISHRFAAGAGRPDLIATAHVSLDGFQRYFEGFNAEPAGAVVLVRSDGTLLTRRPYDEAQVGRDLSRGALFRDQLPRAPTGTFETVSVVDGVERIVSYRRIEAWPLVVVASASKHDVLAPWRAQAQRDGALLVAIIGVLLALAVWSLVEARECERAERRVHDYLSCASDWFWETDAQGRFKNLVGNPASTLALPHTVIEGRTRWEMAGADPESPEWRPYVSAIQEMRGFRDFQYALPSYDGTTRWLRVSGKAVFGADGRFLGHCGITSDFTERRRVNEALWLRDRALQAIGQGILILDAEQPDAPIIYANPAFERMTGYTQEEIIGRPCGFFAEPEAWQDVAAEFRTAVAERRSAEGLLLSRREDGSTFWSDVRVSPVPDEAGVVRHIVWTQSDVTERLRLQDQLRQSTKMEALGKLTGGIAHDFNNLLTIILGNAEILVEEARDEDTHGLAVMVLEAAERGADLTNRLLTFGRRQTLRPTHVVLSHVVIDMLKMLRRTVGESVSIVTLLPPTPQAAFIDQSLFEAALLNLVVNARDAMPSGGTLTIEVSDVEIGLDAGGQLDPGRYYRIEVSDTGVGMSEDVLRRACDPFFTTKEAGKGSGLGLAMVHGFAHQSGGTLSIASEVGRGTSIALLLPQAEAPASQAEEPALPDPLARGTGTVLVVEDEDVVRRHVAGQLRQLGYEVVEAPAAPPALEALQGDARISLLFTDLVLPGPMNGVELAAKARSLRPDLKVLLTSGYSEDVVKRSGLPGDVLLLRKPYHRRELAEAIHRAAKAAAA